MARGGFLGVVHRELKRAARESERRQRESHRAHAAAVRHAAAEQKRAQQAYERALKASAADQKRIDKEAKECHQAAMEAEVERLNLELEEIAADLEGILAATLDVDDFVDLETLKVSVYHPPFLRPDLQVASRPPLPVTEPPVPILVEPPPPKGILSVFGKKKHESRVMEARAKYQYELSQWELAMEHANLRRIEEAEAYQEKERMRLAELQVAEEQYAAECAERENAAAERNQAVEELIANLGYGIPEAIEEYIGIVISNAIYPDHFPVEHEYTYHPELAELKLRVAVPPPDQLSTVKAYKYTKSTDEITTVPLTAKACRDRYAGAIHQVALRAPHEIFEADRRGLIGSISVEVGTNAVNPATGIAGFIPFVALGVGRDEFMQLELSNVLPAATLAHLGASVSKNPYELVPTNVIGIRRS